MFCTVLVAFAERRGRVMTKQESKNIYGLAILLMLYHHLFCVPERLGCEYFSLMSFNVFGGISLERRIAWFGKICVALYAFVSGYGLCISFDDGNGTDIRSDYKKIAERYLCFIRKVGLVYIIFIPLGILIGKQRFHSFFEFLWCMVWPKSSINGEWWYVNTYTTFLILFPLLNAIFKEYKEKAIIYRFMFFVGFCINLYVLRSIAGTPSLIYLTIFIEGYVIAKFEIFKRADKIIGSLKIIPIAVLMVSTAARLTLADGPSYNRTDIILIGFFVYGFTRTVRITGAPAILGTLGKYSTYMWLLHTFLCYYYFREFFVCSKVSTLMYIQLIMGSFLIAYGLSKLEDRFCQFYRNNFAH